MCIVPCYFYCTGMFGHIVSNFLHDKYFVGRCPNYNRSYSINNIITKTAEIISYAVVIYCIRINDLLHSMHCSFYRSNIYISFLVSFFNPGNGDSCRLCISTRFYLQS